MSEDSWMKCPHCDDGTELKEENLNDHLRKMHPSEYNQKNDFDNVRIDKSNLTVLNDYGNPSHRETAEILLKKLRSEMDQEEQVEFLNDIKDVVIKTMLRDLEGNLKFEDWHGIGFKEPEHFLNAEKMSDAISDTMEWYWEDDQTGKSGEVLRVILEYSEKHGLVERESKNTDGDRNE